MALEMWLEDACQDGLKHDVKECRRDALDRLDDCGECADLTAWVEWCALRDAVRGVINELRHGKIETVVKAARKMKEALEEATGERE